MQVNRYRFYLSLFSITFLVLSVNLGFAASGRTLVNQGNKLLKYPDSTKKAEALEKFLEARDKRKTRFEIPFNIASTYEELGRTGEAQSWFEEAARSPNKKVKSDAYYQMGNMMFRQKKYDDAIKCYTESLRSVPSDTNTRKNLELAMLMKQVQQPDSSKQDQKNQQDQKKQQNPDSTKQQQPKQHDKMLDQARNREADLQKKLMQKRNQGDQGGASSGKDW